MIKENRNPHFVSICERCGEINVFLKTDKVPGYCPVCGYRSLYKVGYITSSEKVEHNRNEGQVLGEILDELKKINEYVEYKKQEELGNIKKYRKYPNPSDGFSSMLEHIKSKRN